VQRVLSTLAREIPHENRKRAEMTCNSLHVGNVLPKAQRGPLGLWLYESREEKLGLTREQVAAAIGVNAATVTRAERPKGVAPDTRASIARFYQREAANRGIELGEPPLPAEAAPAEQSALAAAIDRQTAMLEAVLTRLGDLLAEARRQGAEEREAILDAVADVRAALPAEGTEVGSEPRSRTLSGQ
jgi:transcriptional regulator with XRE-family HTH domain